VKNHAVNIKFHLGFFASFLLERKKGTWKFEGMISASCSLIVIDELSDDFDLNW
jgi:hypothetical protein